MSEIEKMYENAGINQVCNTCELRGFKRLCPTKELCVRTNPPFTTEKQIELIKLLAKGEVKINNEDGEYEFSIFDTVSDFSSFEESLADLVNRMWQDLTEEEKQQVKGILE